MSLGLMLGGCASVDLESFQRLNLSEKLRLPAAVSSQEFAALRPATAEDLVDQEGHCVGGAPATASAASNAAGGDPVTTPSAPVLVAGGVALTMTECEVVKRAGQPEKVEIGTNARGERSAVLTYLQGPHPGIYSFVAGRLMTIERAPEPPKSAKSAKPAKSPKAAAPAKPTKPAKPVQRMPTAI